MPKSGIKATIFHKISVWCIFKFFSKTSVTSVEFLIRKISSFWTPKAYQYPTRGYSRVILALQIESIPLVNFTNYTSSQVRKQISRFWKRRNSNLILAEWNTRWRTWRISLFAKKCKKVCNEICNQMMSPNRDLSQIFNLKHSDHAQ